MAKFNIGDKIKGTSLEVVSYTSPSRVKCKCTECSAIGGDALLDEKLVSFTFNEADLVNGTASCRLCKEKKLFEERGYFKDRDEYLALTQKMKIYGGDWLVYDQDELPDSGISKSEKIRNNVIKGDTNSLNLVAYRTKYKGVHYRLGQQLFSYDVTGLVLRCPNCGYTKIMPPKSLRGKQDDCFCPICTKLRANVAKSTETRRLNTKIRAIEKSAKKDFIKAQTVFDKAVSNKRVQKSINTLESISQDFSVVDISKLGTGNTLEYKCMCKKCGNIVTSLRSNKRITECTVCKRNSEHPELKPKLGVLHKSYIDSVFNYLRIISQDGTTCSVKCEGCGKVRDNLSLYDVINRKYCCDCDYSSDYFKCSNPQCNHELGMYSYADVLKGNVPEYCPECGEYCVSSINMTVAETDSKLSLRRKIQKLNESINKDVSRNASNQLKFTNCNNGDLLVESSAIYSGTDEKSYYRCYCKKHNVPLILSEEELLNYECEYCDDSRQKIIANPDADSISMS